MLESKLQSLFPWTEPAYLGLVDQFRSSKLPHALLLEGAEGIGKGLLAKSLAAKVMCLDEDKTKNEACGKCKACKLLEADSHPDFKWIAPEDGSRIIKVDAIRSLVEFVSHSSSQGGFKVVVLNPAEAMNNNSANALLKTLEEPTKNTLIILVTSRPGYLVPTIRSRCQAILVKQPQRQQAMQWLKVAGVDPDKLAPALSLANGSPISAYDLVQEGLDEECDAMLGELAQVLKRQINLSGVAEKWSDDIASDRVAWLSQWIQQIIRYSSLKDSAVFPHPDSVKMFQYIGDKTSSAVLFDLYQYLHEQWVVLQGPSNPDKVLLFESILIRWQKLMLKSARVA